MWSQSLPDRERRAAAEPALSSALTTALAKTLREYSLAASTPVSGEYAPIVETRGGTSLTQTDADRKPAAATAANGLPVMTFDGTDVLLQALESGNNGTSSWWCSFWCKPADFGALQRIYSAVVVGLSGLASANRLRWSVNGATGRISWDVFMTGNNGRSYTATSVGFTAGVWNHGYLVFDSAQASEADTDGITSAAKFRIAVGSTFVALTPADIGTPGGTPSALNAATGSATIGGGSDSDTPASPLRNGGQLGPRMRFGSTPLTQAELTALAGFEVPT